MKGYKTYTGIVLCTLGGFLAAQGPALGWPWAADLGQALTLLGCGLGVYGRKTVGK